MTGLKPALGERAQVVAAVGALGVRAELLALDAELLLGLVETRRRPSR
jgi:hypothetical protein